jgi:putative glutamine amidotransferase
MRPIVGLTAAIERVSYRAWKEMPAAVSPLGYVRAVQAAGGRAVLLPPDSEDTRDPKELLGSMDALVLTGGLDLDPALYGQEPHPETGSAQKGRDAYELALARAAVEHKVPVLGVCRGMQVLNVAYGGSIEQHLPDVLGHEEHRPTPGAFADHEVRLEPDSLAAYAVGAERTSVKSHHHQGVREVGDGLRVTGRSAMDDVIEALEDPSCPFVLGVLWHPEEDEKSQLIRALVSEVK